MMTLSHFRYVCCNSYILILNPNQKYFWIPYMLCFKILFLGFPRLLWKSLEGGLIYKLTRELDTKKHKNIIRSANYFVLTLHSYKRRAIIFLICEAIGVATILTSMFLTNWFLEGKFLQAIPPFTFQYLKSGRNRLGV
ncbi:Innexin inx2 [Armadillidium vulgare]|nr:Innexin inx2 [Armadillidium vulgare]